MRDLRGLGPSWNVLGHLHFGSSDRLTWCHVMVLVCVLLRKIKWNVFHMYFMAIWILTFMKFLFKILLLSLFSTEFLAIFLLT